MTLLANGSLANIYAALDLYLSQVIDGTIAIQQHGQRRFVRPSDNPWLEVHYDFLGLQSQFLRQIGGQLPSATLPGYDESVYGTERRGQLQLNIYQRARIFPQRYTTAAARDLVVNAFPDGTIIAVYDTTVPGDTGFPLVGNIITSDVTDHVMDTGYKSGVIQHIVQIDTRYIERYTRG